ncbi:hypothetical protein [Corallococcus llansteffanensis]|uniref:hypothetical protein n=1 Tax=Corallococcus llansteffanensis TaxID=2316731 RepID=UPI0011C42588|nr:hypothetical protein [Corallococcus llansteffanensis]
MIEDRIVRVGRDSAMAIIKPMLNGYRGSWSRIYIGVSAKPSRRWVKHMRNGWSKMVLLYEAFRPDIAVDLERDLIDYARRCNFLMPPENISSGGEGIGNIQQSYFVYLIVGE